MTLTPAQNAARQFNSARHAARAPKTRPWQARRFPVELIQDGLTNEWKIVCSGGNPIPATDIEVSLWLELQELKEKCCES